MVNVKLAVKEPIPVVPFDVLTVHFYLGAAEAIPLASPLHLEYPEPAVLEVEVRVPRGKRLVWVAVQEIYADPGCIRLQVSVDENPPFIDEWVPPGHTPMFLTGLQIAASRARIVVDGSKCTEGFEFKLRPLAFVASTETVELLQTYYQLVYYGWRRWVEHAREPKA